MRVEIPFRPHFRDAMIAGRKTVTSRNKKYGNPGDEFEAFGYVFVIERHERTSLRTVAEHYYEAEGFVGSMSFRAEWRSIHPLKGYDPDQRVWVHWFRRKDKKHDRRANRFPVARQLELDPPVGYITPEELTANHE